MKTSTSLATLAILLSFASTAQAQSGPRADSIASSNDTVAVATHPNIRLSAIDSRSAVQRNLSATPSAPFAMASSNANLGQSKALMIVGGAALITGAIINGKPGTFIMVGGAIVGLYGLYLYLQ